jgi:hypothetical protein
VEKDVVTEGEGEAETVDECVADTDAVAHTVPLGEKE